MLKLANRKPYYQNNLAFQIIASCVLGLAVGVASVWPILLFIIGTIYVIYVVVKRSEIGLLGYLVLSSTLINNNDLPRISIGVGRLLITDIILLALLGLIMLRALFDRDFKIARSPLSTPLLIFVGVALFSTGVAIFQSRVTISHSLSQIRVFISYLAFFVVTNLVRQEGQISTLLKGTYLLAIIVSSAMIAQFILGNSVQILPGRVETLGTEGVSFMGVTRIIPPGEALIFPAFLVVTTMLIIGKLKFRNILELLSWGMTGIAVILTFKRNLWIAASIVLILLAFLGSWRNRVKMVGGILLLTILFSTLSIFSQGPSEANRLINGVLHRISSLADPQTFEDPNSSLRSRDIEYRYALPHIASRPIMGLGLGAIYRPRIMGWDPEGTTGSTYIHNGHLDIIVKTGVLGYISFLVFTTIALVRGFKYWHTINDLQLKSIYLGFTLAYLGILIGSFVSPMIVTAWWTPVIGIMLGTNEAILSNSLPRNMETSV